MSLWAHCCGPRPKEARSLMKPPACCGYSATCQFQVQGHSVQVRRSMGGTHWLTCPHTHVRALWASAGTGILAPSYDSQSGACVKQALKSSERLITASCCWSTVTSCGAMAVPWLHSSSVGFHPMHGGPRPGKRRPGGWRPLLQVCTQSAGGWEQQATLDKMPCTRQSAAPHSAKPG